MKLNHTRYEEFRHRLFAGDLELLEFLDFLEFDEVLLENKVKNLFREYQKAQGKYEGILEDLNGMKAQKQFDDYHMDTLQDEIYYLRNAKDELEKEIYDLRANS